MYASKISFKTIQDEWNSNNACHLDTGLAGSVLPGELGHVTNGVRQWHSIALGQQKTQQPR